MINAVIILILAAIIGGIVFYLKRQKRKGVHCVGCPYAKKCSGNCNNKSPEV